MDPHQIKRVDVQPADRIRVVMAVRQMVVVIDHKATAGAPRCIRPAVLPQRRQVHLRQEFPDRPRDRISPTKRSDDVLFCQRILHLFSLCPAPACFSRTCRPLRDVGPLPVTRQHVRRIQKRRVADLKNWIHVHAMRRPEHQPVRLVGCVVEGFYVDRLRELASDGLVLLRADFPREWNDQPQPRLLRCVLMR